MTDALDAKLAAVNARVTQRNAERTATARAQLAAIDNGSGETALEVAELCREKFGAKVAYLGPPEGFPHGQPYNFDLVGPVYLAEQAKREAIEATKSKPARTWRSGTDRAAGAD